MEISVLEEFISLVETCSFQETAAIMNISQSSLTKHIHKLEEELNLSLFDRSSRSVKLNEFSKGFYPYAKQIVQTHHDGLAHLHELASQNVDQIIIAYTPVLGQYGLVDTIAAFSRKYPAHKLMTIESYQPLSLLRQKKCNFAFISENDLTDDSYNRMIYRTDHLAAVLPDTHRFAGRTSVSLDDLRDEPMILHSSATTTPHEETQKFLELCAARNFTPNVVAESQYTATMVRYVGAGRGIAILNRLHIPNEVPNVAVVDIYPLTYSYIYLLYPRRLKAPSAQDFLNFVMEQLNA